MAAVGGARAAPRSRVAAGEALRQRRQAACIVGAAGRPRVGDHREVDRRHSQDPRGGIWAVCLSFRAGRFQPPACGIASLSSVPPSGSNGRGSCARREGSPPPVSSVPGGESFPSDNLYNAHPPRAGQHHRDRAARGGIWAACLSFPADSSQPRVFRIAYRSSAILWDSNGHGSWKAWGDNRPSGCSAPCGRSSPPGSARFSHSGHAGRCHAGHGGDAPRSVHADGYAVRSDWHGEHHGAHA